MKYCSLLILVITISGCYSSLSGEKASYFIDSCEQFGGVDYIYIDRSNSDLTYAECKESNMRVNSGDL